MKAELNKLAGEFLISTDVPTLINLRETILLKVISCGYSEGMKTITSLAVPLWGNDLSKYIHAVNQGNSTGDLKQVTELALVGLINLVDMSQLLD